MKTVCLYFQVHQPWRLKKYRFFNMGKDHNYLDDLMNRSIMQKVARQCYLPMNALLLKLIRENKGKFRCSFSITGIAIEQFRAFAPEVLDSFKELAATGCVEFLAETYSHSLASLASKEDFTEQVKLHTNLIKKEFGVKPTAFRNTELIYSDEIGAMVAGMGFRTMLAEGAKHVLGWKSPNYVYANAIDSMKGVDIAFDSYVNEFVLGKKRVMVKPSAQEYLDGEPVFDPDDLAYYVLPEDIEGGAIIQPIDMQLRTAEHSEAIRIQLNLLSSKCGFGENHYRFDRGSITTATQVISENSTMFRTIKKHEIILESAIKELCRIILHMGNTAMGAGLNEDAEVTIDFDDSIIEDKTTERNNDRQDLAAGIMNDWEYRMKWYNEDEATAKKMLPKMEDLTNEPQDDVE